MENLVREFEEYREDIRQSKRKTTIREDRREDLLRRYTVKLLYKWDNKKFDREYWGWLEKNWLRWKGKTKLERIDEEEEETKERRTEKWDEEDKLGNL